MENQFLLFYQEEIITAFHLTKTNNQLILYLRVYFLTEKSEFGQNISTTLIL